ncbi:MULTISPECIES: recombinase family protein [Rhodococcus]|uniref:Recombinase family protein n=1 Tax=Rhodococcus oxybenzonivorans TaxID=1990687 RepID=A0AAE4V473_9NOCA|nr:MULTISPECIES: recombinase family protein [Rhodococcus]MDV7243274.1 recombinase family protein [Rhodococcus oxybenzonivorans]MDV7267513.1 recombinase family protein [Rhodococcus oxybenzonivorans]MDV7276702.1 recombinase family protein [Rhodococcus oxybenzonivorans]MDV7334467.1 recombinase family protein [Rhodococcus oxybenzonivorans]MDV7344621.1 recombinase family protein [Rhodococcus oxybenzonivorans]
MWETRAGLDRMLDDAAKGHFTVVRVVWRDRLVRFGVAWIERYLSVVGVTVEVLREHGDTSVGEELIDDFMALLASFSGRFCQLRSRLNRRRLLGRCGSTVCGGNPMKTVDTQKRQRKVVVRADRVLCQVRVVGWLGIRVHYIGAAMRASDIATPLDITTAEDGVGGTEPARDWFAELLAEKAARTARRAAAKEAQPRTDTQAEKLRTDRMYQLLDAGKLRSPDDEMLTVDDVVFRASKDLVKGAATEDLCAGELSELRVVGGNPHDHRWAYAGRCDGTGHCCCPKNEVLRGSLTLVLGEAA